MAYFKMFASNLHVEITGNTTINLIQSSHPATSQIRALDM
jgi:hypothetical protein